jgi:N-acetylmuramoyl-L-alanine amidase
MFHPRKTVFRKSCFGPLFERLSLRQRFPTAALAALGLGIVFFLTGCVAPGGYRQATGYNTVVLDPGHGGHDSGTMSRNERLVTTTKTVKGKSTGKGKNAKPKQVTTTRVVSGGGARILEKDVALDVALRVRRHLREAGLKVVMTRRDDTFIPLPKRAAISNAQRNSIFVSIHFNDSRKRDVHGMETYQNSRGTEQLAARIERAIASCPSGVNRGVRKANYHVLRNSKGPAVLVECAYLSNPDEAARVANPAYREALAAAIARAILEQRG